MNHLLFDQPVFVTFRIYIVSSTPVSLLRHADVSKRHESRLIPERAPVSVQTIYAEDTPQVRLKSFHNRPILVKTPTINIYYMSNIRAPLLLLNADTNTIQLIHLFHLYYTYYSKDYIVK